MCRSGEMCCLLDAATPTEECRGIGLEAVTTPRAGKPLADVEAVVTFIVSVGIPSLDESLSGGIVRKYICAARIAEVVEFMSVNTNDSFRSGSEGVGEVVEDRS